MADHEYFIKLTQEEQDKLEAICADMEQTDDLLVLNGLIVATINSLYAGITNANICLKADQVAQDCGETLQAKSRHEPAGDS